MSTIDSKLCQNLSVIVKAPITTAADDIHKYFVIVFQRKKDLMFQVNPRQRIHMKNQALLSSKDKSKKLKKSSAAVVISALRVKIM